MQTAPKALDAEAGAVDQQHRQKCKTRGHVQVLGGRREADELGQVRQHQIDAHGADVGRKGAPVFAQVVLTEVVDEPNQHLCHHLPAAGHLFHAVGQPDAENGEERDENPAVECGFRHRDSAEQRDLKGGFRLQRFDEFFLNIQSYHPFSVPAYFMTKPPEE